MLLHYTSDTSRRPSLNNNMFCFKWIQKKCKKYPWKHKKIVISLLTKFHGHRTGTLWNVHFHAHGMQMSLEQNCWFVGLKDFGKTMFAWGAVLQSRTVPATRLIRDFWTVNEKARGGVRGAALCNSQWLYTMRFQLVHDSLCLVCNSGGCQSPQGVGAGEREIGLWGGRRIRKARMDELNQNVCGGRQGRFYRRSYIHVFIRV